MKNDKPVTTSFPLVIVSENDEVGYLVTSPVMPALVAAGGTVRETLQNLRTALSTILDMSEQSGEPFPDRF